MISLVGDQPVRPPVLERANVVVIVVGHAVPDLHIQYDVEMDVNSDSTQAVVTAVNGPAF